MKFQLFRYRYLALVFMVGFVTVWQGLRYFDWEPEGELILTYLGGSSQNSIRGGDMGFVTVVCDVEQRGDWFPTGTWPNEKAGVLKVKSTKHQAIYPLYVGHNDGSGRFAGRPGQAMLGVTDNLEETFGEDFEVKLMVFVSRSRPFGNETPASPIYESPLPEAWKRFLAESIENGSLETPWIPRSALSGALPAPAEPGLLRYRTLRMISLEL